MPLRRKLTPAAFPTLTAISRVARTEVCAGAIRVSWAIGLPSAVIETHVVSSARIVRLKVAAGFAVGLVALSLTSPSAPEEGTGGLGVLAVADVWVDVGGGNVAEEFPMEGFVALEGCAIFGEGAVIELAAIELATGGEACTAGAEVDEVEVTAEFAGDSW